MRTISLFIILVMCILICISINIAIALVAIALLLTPLTYLYGKLTQCSYHELKDSSEHLYQLCRIGEWSWIVFVGFIIIYLTFKTMF